MNTRPLVVDLDGTLLKTDLLIESLLLFIRHYPWRILSLLAWLLRGRSYLKHQVAQHVEFDAAVLPYTGDLLLWLRQQHADGRQIVLATGSNQKHADQIAAHLGLFSAVHGSGAAVNLTGQTKCSLLRQIFGERNFDYAGNARVDLPIWSQAAKIIMVNAPASLRRLVTRRHGEPMVLGGADHRLLGLLKAMRLHQWIKNLLIFTPLLFAHQFTQLDQLLTSLHAFVAFGLCASSVYLLNDLLDIQDDRHHPSKCRRPFASGAVPALWGLLAAPALLLAALLLGWQVSPAFLLVLGCYYLVTLLYSLAIKRVVLLDAVTLGLLYTLRIIAGGAATGIPLSLWLLSFAMFLFLSLAIAKRCTELRGKTAGGLRGRGYRHDDQQIMLPFGIASGYLSVLVLALYINSNEIQLLYRQPQWLWATCPLLLYWVSYFWLKTHRGDMHHDPILFALRDKTSLLIGGVMFLLLIMAI